MELKSLSVTSMRSYAACGKKWQLERGLHLPFKPSESMVFGSAVHAGLETWNHAWFKDRSTSTERPYNIFQRELMEGLTKGLLVESFEDEIERPMTPADEEEFEKFKVARVEDLQSKGLALLDMHAVRTDHGDEKILIEDEVSGTIEGLPYRMVIDLLDKKDGKVRLKDYKTRSKDDRKLERMQFSGYVYGLAEFRGIKVDIIQQVNLIKTKTPAIVVLDYDMAEINKDVSIFRQEVVAFVKGVSADVFPRNRDHFCATCGVQNYCFNPDEEEKLRKALAQRTPDLAQPV